MQQQEPPSIRFYRRADCLLCELAEAWLRDIPGAFTAIDIDAYPALEARYGTRVPVLCRGDGAELAWPFDPDALRVFLGAC